LIGIVIATELEAEPLIPALGLSQTEEQPFKIFANDDMVLVICGIGKANAAMATALCCREYKPQWICSLGAAGATSKGHPLGAIYHITKVTEIDRPRYQSEDPVIRMPHILDGFPTATLATQDHPVIDPDERQKVSLQANLVDMESAAVLQACRKYAIPCVLFRFVSDTPDEPEHHDIVRNIELYRDDLARFFINAVLPRLRDR